MPDADSFVMPLNGVFSFVNIVTLMIAVTTRFFAVSLRKPDRVVLEGTTCSPAPTVTPSAALTCAGVTSAQASVGGAASAICRLLKVKTRKALETPAATDFQFISSSFGICYLVPDPALPFVRWRFTAQA